MAAKMNSSVLDNKIKVVEDLEAEFHKKLTVFASDVKTKMQTSSQELANQVFELTLLFLTQAFPNIHNMESTGMESSEDKVKMAEKLKEIEELKTTTSPQQMPTTTTSTSSPQVSTTTTSTSSPQVSTTTTSTSAKSSPKVSTTTTSTSAKSSPKVSTTTTSTSAKLSPKVSTTTTSTSAKSSPKVSTTTTSTSETTVHGFGASAGTATLSGAPLSLSQKSTFKLQVRDNLPLTIWDIKLLSSSLLLVADWSNECVRLFDTKGQQLSTLKLQRLPSSLAILNQKSPSCWNVAVAFPVDHSIGLLEINNQTLSIKIPQSVINTQRGYHRIAAVSNTTLAAGYSGIFGGSGVDLIDLSGKVLRSICSGVWPNYMVTTEDQCLIILDSNKTFYKFNLQQGTQDIKRDFSQIGCPESIACLQSGSSIVLDSDKKVLHLVEGDGSVKRILWRCPIVERGDYLDFVSVMKDVCVCCTRRGSVFVFNVQGI